MPLFPNKDSSFSGILSIVSSKIQDEVRTLNTKLEALNVGEVSGNVESINRLAEQMKVDLQKLYSVIPETYPSQDGDVPAVVGDDATLEGTQVGGYIWRNKDKKSRKRRRSKKSKSITQSKNTRSRQSKRSKMRRRR